MANMISSSGVDMMKWCRNIWCEEPPLRINIHRLTQSYKSFQLLKSLEFNKDIIALETVVIVIK